MNCLIKVLLDVLMDYLKLSSKQIQNSLGPTFCLNLDTLNINKSQHLRPGAFEEKSILTLAGCRNSPSQRGRWVLSNCIE